MHTPWCSTTTYKNLSSNEKLVISPLQYDPSPLLPSSASKQWLPRTIHPVAQAKSLKIIFDSSLCHNLHSVHMPVCQFCFSKCLNPAIYEYLYVDHHGPSHHHLSHYTIGVLALVVSPTVCRGAREIFSSSLSFMESSSKYSNPLLWPIRSCIICLSPHYQSPLCSSLTTMISCYSNTTISFLPHGLHYSLFLVSRTALPRLPQACSFRSVCSLRRCHIQSSSLTTLLKWHSPAFSNP